ncbi:hypothetical protein B0H13DRAFT_2664348 [Mycena leptocephala]|nr:hypothetical protein B0H13DRAFT_2664348 [Mycena leptocephala]
MPVHLLGVFADSTIGTDADAAKALGDIAASDSGPKTHAAAPPPRAAAALRLADPRQCDLAASTTGVLAEHTPALVRTLLGYTKDSSALTSTRIRIASLRCLGALPGVMTYAVLHPCKAEVLRELRDALNDPERGVRREAVDAREVCG